MSIKRNQRAVLFPFLLVLICILLSTGVSTRSLHTMATRSQKDLNILLAARIHDQIESALTEPVVAAKTMANDGFLLYYLQTLENPEDAQTDISRMSAYLSRLKNGLKYDSVFVVSDATGRYYTPDGLNKIIDPENDPHDVWYSLCVEKNKEYDLDVDMDEVNSNTWTVFVNARMEDPDGRLLGICGVGIVMNDLQEVLAEFENVTINLVDANGLVQVDIQEINIENAYLEDVPFQEAGSEYIYQQRPDGTSMVTKYIDTLGWYLVIQTTSKPMSGEYLRVTLVNVGLFLLVAVVYVLANHLVQIHNRSLLKTTYWDHLTGIRNRRAYGEEIDQLLVGKLPPDLVYLIADLNGLKKVNDSLGHAAGDELLRGAGECLQASFGKFGHVFRIGGDEFAGILRISPNQYEAALEAFQKNTDAWSGELVKHLSISVGFVPRWEHYNASLCEITAMADRRMYEAKNAYYSQPAHDRRK